MKIKDIKKNIKNFIYDPFNKQEVKQLKSEIKKIESEKNKEKMHKEEEQHKNMQLLENNKRICNHNNDLQNKLHDERNINSKKDIEIQRLKEKLRIVHGSKGGYVCEINKLRKEKENLKSDLSNALVELNQLRGRRKTKITYNDLAFPRQAAAKRRKEVKNEK